MPISNKPGPSGKLLVALLMVAAFQVVNFNLVFVPLKAQWYGVGVASVFVLINAIGAVAVKFPKWGQYLWTILFLVNFGLVSQGLVLVAQLLGADAVLVWLIGLPLWVFLSVQLHRYLASAIRSE